MRYADLHCDALWRASLHPEEFSHLESEPFSGFDGRIQAFALFLSEDADGNALFDAQLALFHRWLDEGSLTLWGEKNGISAKTAAFLTIENAGKLSPDRWNAEFLWKHRIRFASLTWNGENPLAGGCETGGPIREAGFHFIKAMREAGTIPDVSHLSEKGFYQLADADDGVFVATHSNAASVLPHKRNLSDDQLKILFARGGLVGLNLHAPFVLEKTPCSRKESIEALNRHLKHLLDLGGAEHLAFGCDYDGGTPLFGLSGVKDLAIYYDDVLKYFGTAVADRLFYDNVSEFLSRRF